MTDRKQENPPVVDWQDDLDAWVAGDGVPDEPDEPEQPDDPVGADRLLRRIRRYERLLDELKTVAADNHRSIDEFYADRSAGLAASIGHAARNLEGWMRGHHDRTGVLSVQLPAGTPRLRTGRATVEVLDEEAALEPGALPDLWVRVRETVDKDAVGRYALPGAVVPAGPAVPPPPEGRVWREALAVTGAAVVGGWAAVPSVRAVPGVVFAWPTGRRFSYTTNKRDPRNKETEQ